MKNTNNQSLMQRQMGRETGIGQSLDSQANPAFGPHPSQPHLQRCLKVSIDRNGALARLLSKVSQRTASKPAPVSSFHDVLGRIKELMEKGFLRVELHHALQRAQERNIKTVDIRNALLTGYLCIWQEDHETWKVKGYDLSGDDLIVTIHGELSIEVRVVTVF